MGSAGWRCGWVGGCAALAVAGCAGPEPLRLLLLLSVDTLRADHLGAYGGALGLTPALDALAAESLVFEAAYAPSALTLPSIAGLLTGQHPALLGIQSNESELPEGAQTLAEELRGAGWRTAAVVSNYVLRRGSGFAAGFDVYDDALPQLEATRGWPERIAESTTDAALAALEGCAESAARPCFLWVHYEDPHGPYTPPPGLRERALPAQRRRPDAKRQLPLRADQRGQGGIPAYQALGGEREVAFYRAGYAGEVGYIDTEIGRLLSQLRERIPWAATAVVFAADHGESLGEDDLWFAHGELLSEPLVRVPLLLRLPGSTPARRRDVAALTDLAPTLARHLGAAQSPLAARGRDLLAADAAEGGSRVALAALRGSGVPRFALIDDGHKLAQSLEPGAEQARLSALGTDAPDLSPSEPLRLLQLRRILDEFRSEIERAPAERRQRLSEADRERLRSLGYAL